MTRADGLLQHQIESLSKTDDRGVGKKLQEIMSEKTEATPRKSERMALQSYVSECACERQKARRTKVAADPGVPWRQTKPARLHPWPLANLRYLWSLLTELLPELDEVFHAPKAFDRCLIGCKVPFGTRRASPDAQHHFGTAGQT